jgi:carboxyl-terminal processing protease
MPPRGGSDFVIDYRTMTWSLLCAVLVAALPGRPQAAAELRRRHVDRERILGLASDAPLESIVAALGDPWTRIMNRQDAKAFLRDVTGQVKKGLGLPELLSLDIDPPTGLPQVVTPVVGSPAARAGLRPRDRIEAIDGTATKDLQWAEVMHRLRPAPGTPVRLRILRGAERVDVTLRSASFDEPPVVRATMAGHALHLAISSLTAGTPDAVASELRRHPAAEVVVDLRNNPGGDLMAALRVAGLFVGPRDVAREQTASGTQTLRATGQRIGHPRLSVVVNEGTASAAELVATALQVAGARVTGAPTIGKCLVHSYFQMEDGALLYTVARLASLDGRSLCEGVRLAK